VIELAEIFRGYGPAYREKFGARLLPSHRRAMRSIEQCRTAALGGDKMMATPVMAVVGAETWKAKESSADETTAPGWGPQVERAVLWEETTAVTFLQAGVDILVMRHPKAITAVQAVVADLMS